MWSVVCCWVLWIPNIYLHLFHLFTEVGILNTMFTKYSYSDLSWLTCYYLLSITPFFKQSIWLHFQPRVFPDYTIFSNCGYANLSKCLWLCIKACSNFVISLLYWQTSRYLDTFLLNLLKCYWRTRGIQSKNTFKNPVFAESQTYFLKWKTVFVTRKLGSVWL